MAPTEILAEQHFATVQRLLDASRFRVALLTGATPAREASRSAGTADRGRRRSTSSSARTRSSQEAVRVPRARPRRHRRAAPLRRPAARDAAREGAASRRARDDGDADPADAGADGLRRSRRVGRSASCRPGRTPVQDDRRSRTRGATRSTRFVRERARRRAGRPTSSIRSSRSPRRSTCSAATEMADHLAHDVFPAYRVALLHGRMKPDEKDRVMRAFAARRDPRARRDDRHRGRHRRAERDGDGDRARRAVRPVAAAPAARPRRPRQRSSPTCVLLYQSPLTEDGRERLKAMTETTDGFVIAETRPRAARPRRLLRHAPGRGCRRCASATCVRDHALMEEARREAVGVARRRRLRPAWLEEFRRTWGQRFGLIGVG